MDDLDTPIKRTEVAGIVISTIYQDNLPDHITSILEEIGKEDTPEAAHLRQIREETKGNADLLDPIFKVPMLGPYYETVVVGGKWHGATRRCNSVTEAMDQHEACVDMVKESLQPKALG